jgi:probable HAF family extracellular repeat protein
MTEQFVVGFATVALLLSGAARARADYIVTDLSTVLGNWSSRPGGVTGLNDAGQMVGSFSNQSWSPLTPFLYDHGSLTYLGENNFVPSSINNSGAIIGQTTTGVSGIYSNGTMTWLGRLSGEPIISGFATSVSRINDSGQAVGGSYVSGQTTHAFVYSGGKMVDLGALAGPSVSSVANGINNAGQIVGTLYGSAPNQPTSHAFLYSGGKMIDLSPVLGSLTSSFTKATTINNAGQIIGQFNTANGQYHAFLYSGGKATDLGTLGGSPNRAFYSVASAINNAGTVVGESGPNFGLTRAFVFTNGKLTDLNSMVPANSGWVLDSAFAINNKGQILASGRNANFTENSFLLTPVSEAPEPGSLSLFGLGALGLAGHAWRKRRQARGKSADDTR